MYRTFRFSSQVHDVNVNVLEKLENIVEDWKKIEGIYQRINDRIWVLCFVIERIVYSVMAWSKLGKGEGNLGDRGC